MNLYRRSMVNKAQMHKTNMTNKLIKTQTQLEFHSIVGSNTLTTLLPSCTLLYDY